MERCCYPARPKANQFFRDGKEHQTDDPGGSGSEIAGEVLVCPDCGRRYGAT
jgi:hypothetical protein